MKKQVFRSESLKGIISKEKAIELLGLELSIKTKIKGHLIEISRDDNYNICIDEIDADGEIVCYTHEYLGMWE